MHRFFLPPEQCRDDFLELAGSEAHHALHVLRLHPGAEAVVLDGNGLRLLCSVHSITRSSLTLSVTHRTHLPEPAWRITLLQAIPKGQLMESIIEKAVELGAWRIVPLLTERTVVRLTPEGSLGKQMKWQATALGAIKQSGSAWLPNIEKPITPNEFLARRETFDLALVGSLRDDATHPRTFFREFSDRHNRRPATVALWIGPEGDFSFAELELIQASGALPITLGPLVLRSDTAATCALAVLNYELSSGSC